MPKSSTLELTVNTFLRYYAMDPTTLVGEINRRMEKDSGGYEFYGALTDAIHAHIRGESDEVINAILQRSGSEPEARYNTPAYEVFKKKFQSKRGLSTFRRTSTLALCGGDLIIKSTPVFAHETKSEMSIYAVWATQKIPLDRNRAGVGVFLTQQAFRESLPNYSFKFFDTVGNRVSSSHSNATASAVENIAYRIVELAKSA